MISFKQYLKEDEYRSEFSKPDHPNHDLWKHGVPALRHLKTKEIHRGKRGEAHWELADQVQHRVGVKQDPFNHYEPGYFHTKNKTFHTRDETQDMDSTDLMTSIQRKRYSERRDLEEATARNLSEPKFNVTTLAMKQLIKNLPSHHIRYVITKDRKLNIGDADTNVHADISNNSPGIKGYASMDKDGNITHHPSYTSFYGKHGRAEFRMNDKLTAYDRDRGASSVRTLHHPMFKKFAKAGIKRVNEPYDFEW